LRYLNSPPQRVLDLGCGAGFFSLILLDKLTKGWDITDFCLVDISETALKKAYERINDAIAYPYIKFKLENLLSIPLDLRKLNSFVDNDPLLLSESYSLIILAQTLWGILENLEETLGAIRRLLTPKGSFIISQHFPKDQNYGKDIVASPLDLARHLKRAGLVPIKTLDTDRTTNHHWAALCQKRE
jgi:SAM-dependent methyltransferase